MSIYSNTLSMKRNSSCLDGLAAVTSNVIDRVSRLFDQFLHIHDPLTSLAEESRALLTSFELDLLAPSWKQASSKHLRNGGGGTSSIGGGAPVSWPQFFQRYQASGDERMRRLEFVLKSIPTLTPHEYQMQFHREISMALLPKIYEQEWDAHSDSILKKYKISNYRPEVLMSTPRRFGKTMGTVQYIIGALYSIPNITIAIFSTGQRTAGKLKNAVTKYLRLMPKFEELCTKNSAEQVSLEFGPGDERSVFCYPGSVGIHKNKSITLFMELGYQVLTLPDPRKHTMTSTTSSSDTSDEEMCLDRNDWVLNRVTGDGNCFFYSILRSLQAPKFLQQSNGGLDKDNPISAHYLRLFLNWYLYQQLFSESKLSSCFTEPDPTTHNNNNSPTAYPTMDLLQTVMAPENTLIKLACPTILAERYDRDPFVKHIVNQFLLLYQKSIGEDLQEELKQQYSKQPITDFITATLRFQILTQHLCKYIFKMIKPNVYVDLTIFGPIVCELFNCSIRYCVISDRCFKWSSQHFGPINENNVLLSKTLYLVSWEPQCPHFDYLTQTDPSLTPNVTPALELQLPDIYSMATPLSSINTPSFVREDTQWKVHKMFGTSISCPSAPVDGNILPNAFLLSVKDSLAKDWAQRKQMAILGEMIVVPLLPSPLEKWPIRLHLFNTQSLRIALTSGMIFGIRQFHHEQTNPYWSQVQMRLYGITWPQMNDAYGNPDKSTPKNSAIYKINLLITKPFNEESDCLFMLQPPSSSKLQSTTNVELPYWFVLMVVLKYTNNITTLEEALRRSLPKLLT